MDGEPSGRVAKAFAGWKLRCGVGNAHIARYGGLAPTTVLYIENGTTARPSTRTIARVAQGMATFSDPPHDRDDQIELACRRDLNYAAGHRDPSDPEPETLLELGIYLETRSELRTALLAEITRRARRVSPEVLRAVAEVIGSVTAEQVRALRGA